MPQVIRILFGATLTLATCGALGSILLRRLNLSLHREEAVIIAFLSGSACTQVVVFTLCTFHLAFPWVLGILAAFSITGASIYVRNSWKGKSVPQPAKAWRIVFAAIYLAFFAVYFINALAPEASPDGSGYHLGNVYRMWQSHGFAWDYHSIYSHMPQGMEMLFLPAYTFGGTSAAALVHFAFFSTLPLLIICYGCRFGFPRAAIFAAVLVYAAPVCGITGTSAYNDLALATLIFAVFYLLQVNSESRADNYLIIIGLLIGECFALKYTGILAAPFAAGVLIGQYRRSSARPLLIAATAAALVAVPWVVRNWIWAGNPVAPFLNSWFPNPYYDSNLEHGYLADLAYYPHFKHYWDLPLDFILFGRVLPGFVGPGFLLAPIGLLALRYPQGRRLVWAAVFFGVPVWFNAAVRFLVPSLAFIALAVGIALLELRGTLPVLAVLHAVLCWPSVVSAYCAPWAWRLREVPWRAAVRREPEPKFLQKRLGDYAWKEPVERLVPATARVYTDAGRPEAYIHRALVVSYESSQGYEVQRSLGVCLANPALRAPSMKKIKGLGISYLLINDSDEVAADLKNYSRFWNITLLAEVNGARLYRLD